MKKVKMVIAAALLASVVAGTAQAAVDPADRAAAVIAHFDQAGDRLLSFFNRLAARAEARGRTALADRLRAAGEAANARLDAFGVKLGCRINPAAEVCNPPA